MLALDDRYNPIYSGLSEVREIFHRNGRLSDSNQKLDETLKLLAIHYASGSGLVSEELYAQCRNKSLFSVKKLEKLFSSVLELNVFQTTEGISLFENSSRLSFADNEEEIAFELFNTLAFSGIGRSDNSLDFLNEAFGHFVRDNFRSNTEDAQYMTPPEVVDFMVNIAASILRDFEKDELIVMDPSCGVGSFLSAFHRLHGKRFPCARFVAQDKVERMVRLTAANFIFSRTEKYEIHLGNSIYEGSPIDKWNAGVDLILTNPPFGAKFTLSEIGSKCAINTPSYAHASGLPQTVDSELIFIDRYLSLLKPGGLCLVVVPDGVISAKGPAAFARASLSKNADILGIVELPAVTFAQAGTRTKTSILIFRKHGGRGRPLKERFFGEVDSIGFEVRKRKGVPVKSLVGDNQLIDMLRIWKKAEAHTIANKDIGAWRDVDLTSMDSWTPRQILFKTKPANGNAPKELRLLRDLVKPLQKRQMRPYRDGAFFISILHVIGEGLLDISSLKSYKPITPGVLVKAGDILVSRINPRIPRVLVVPNLPGEIICSSEFECLEPAEGIDAYKLAYALLTPVAQEQMQSLTAGTSASHSRIKPGKMLDIHVPWAHNAEAAQEMAAHAENLRAVFDNMWAMAERRDRLDAN